MQRQDGQQAFPTLQYYSTAFARKHYKIIFLIKIHFGINILLMQAQVFTRILFPILYVFEKINNKNYYYKKALILICLTRLNNSKTGLGLKYC